MIGLLMRPRDVVLSVHERPDHATDVEQRADELVFLRDRFSWRAALLPPLDLLIRGVWIGALVYLAVAAMAISILDLAGANPAAYAVALLAIHVVFGFEATGFHRWSLRTLGWSEVGVVSGASLTECEMRFFSAWRPALYQPSALPGDASHQQTLLRRLFAAAP